MMTWAELNEVRYLRKEIANVEKEVAALRRSLGIKVPNRNGLPKFLPYDSQVERSVTRIVDAEQRLDNLKKLIDDEVAVRVENKIRRDITDSTARTLFILRYVDCMYFRDIGIAMGYSEAHIYYMHREIGRKIISDWREASC